MNLSPYPNYKTSEIDWLGDIPNHWEKIQIKRKFVIVNGSTPKSSNLENWNGDITWVTPADFSNSRYGYLNQSMRNITSIGLFSCGTTLVPKDSIIVSTRAPIGEIVQAGTTLCTNQGCKTLVVDSEDIYERFYYYSLLCSSNQLNALGLGTTFMELSKDNLGCYTVPLPPLPEQTQIADFLDYKTAQIDRLIDKKTQLIGKLNEKRIAVITQAVTKGLNPSAPLKNSGVEWLGAVPVHWEIMKMSHIVRLKSGESITSMEINPSGPFPVFGGNGLRGYFEEYTHDGNFVLIGRQGALCGNINYASGKFWASEHAIVVTPDRPLVTIWIGELLRVMNLGQYSVSAAQPGIGVEQISRLRMPYPPIDEQKVISEFIEKETGNIQKMIDVAQETVKRLIEYRTALITAAVTGKIDVRGIDIPPESRRQREKT